MAIYSVFCGHSSNRTFSAHLVDRRYHHVFVSNNREILAEAAAAGWTPVYLDVEISEDPVVSAAQSKIPKADPGRITELQGFDYLCYHDDKRLLASDTLSDGVAFLKATGSALGLRPHPHLHGNILFEFSESLGQSRYKSQEAQMAGYISEQVARGYRLRSQLYWTGAILRNMKHPDTAVIDRTWLDHIGQCGIECQISFDFIAQRFPSIALLPIDLLVV